MKRLLIPTTLFLTLLFIVSCKSKQTDSSPSNGNQEIHLALSDTITTLDPQKAHGLASTGLVQLLFEGLTRLDDQGNILPGVAENVHITSDLKTFTFLLKDAKWSNGDPVKASDFAQSWKSQLTPEMKSSANCLLFAIKSAKAALEGKCSLDQVGINVADDKTLVVTLENPTPYFLQLTATPAYFPVHQSSREPNAAQISNGPFCLDSWKPHETIQLKKHESYTSANKVKLNKINFSIVDDHTAAELFKQAKLDWIGSPFSSIGQEAFSLTKTDNTLRMAPAAGTFFLRINIDKGPFSNQKMRQAFSLAIDREAIINEAMKGEGTVAASLVPPVLGLATGQYDTFFNSTKANELFEEALSEMHMTRKTLAPITFSFMTSGTMRNIAKLVQKKWKEVFDIEIILDENDSSSYYEKIFSKEYMLAASTWFADYFDPMSFLSVFQHKDNGTNDTNWANSEYSRLLDASCSEIDPQKRKMILQQAQDILMNELLIMPIFHFSFAFASSEKFHDMTVSPLGNLDLK